MPAALVERGLYSAAEDLVERIPIRTSLTLEGCGRRLPARVESGAYFVLAEAIANALKHSGASELAVVLSRPDAGRLRLEVGDDGIGGASLGLGAGLRSMADRIDTLGGRLIVESPEGHGTRIVAQIPCGS